MKRNEYVVIRALKSHVGDRFNTAIGDRWLYRFSPGTMAREAANALAGCAVSRGGATLQVDAYEVLYSGMDGLTAVAFANGCERCGVRNGCCHAAESRPEAPDCNHCGYTEKGATA